MVGVRFARRRIATRNVPRRPARRWNGATVHGMKLPVNPTPQRRALRALARWPPSRPRCSARAATTSATSCKSSVDCDPNGTRSCDLSQPDGYCTIAGLRRDAVPEQLDVHPLVPRDVPLEDVRPGRARISLRATPKTGRRTSVSRRGLPRSRAVRQADLRAARTAPSRARATRTAAPATTAARPATLGSMVLATEPARDDELLRAARPEAVAAL